MVSRANSTTKGIWEGMEFRQGPCRNVLPFKSDEDKIEECYKHVLVSERNKLAVFERLKAAGEYLNPE